MADKKSKDSKAAKAAAEDVVYVPEAETPVVFVPANDPTKLNTLSVVSIATAATGFGAVAGVITGHVSLAQIRRSGEKGRGLAIAGLITGYVGIAGFALMSAVALGGHWAERGFDGPRNGFSNGQIGSGPMGGQFGGRGQDDDGFGMMGGNTMVVPNSGDSGISQGGQLPGPDQFGGKVTIDSNGNATITLPDGTTKTLTGGPGMMGGKGFGHGFDQGFSGKTGDIQLQPAPLDPSTQTN
ncbi:MAG: hypothetical protein RL196_1230 [Actinomycetota bacterium]|jgi:hypothetical protein